MLICDKKTHLRSMLKEKRAAISKERREAAGLKLLEELLPILGPCKKVLSFHSMEKEIDTSLVNEYLVKEKKLLLPKVSGAVITIYHVKEPSQELQQSSWGIWEPNPVLCVPAQFEEIDCILVPGLGFDLYKQRIGYGKGHYDRLLAERIIRAKSIGVGFKEQLVEEGLSSEAHDIPLDEILLV